MPVDVVYGEPLEGIDVVEVPADLSVLFAAAHERVTGHAAGAHPGDGVVLGRATAILRPVADVDQALDALRSAESPVVLAGPGVVPYVEGLRALAASGCVGVLNTWGAKGVFDWRSPHHLATAGLQARDFELGGLADADLILASGIDDAEATADWRLAPVVEVDPAALDVLAQGWSRSQHDIPVQPLRTELARVTQDGWSREAAPLAPTRVTLHYSEALGADGLVAAEPGTAGYWVARTYPTSRLGGAIVPAEPDRPGFAAACAVISRLVDPDRPVLLALDGDDRLDPDDDRDGDPGVALGAIEPTVARVLEAGAALGVTPAVEVWHPDGGRLSAAEHVARLARLLDIGGVVTQATDPGQLDDMLAVAGPVVAWGGLDGVMSREWS